MRSSWCSRTPTSNVDTYGVGRFLYLAPNADGTITLDFNRAVLPPCAFSYNFNCPLPPKQNRFAVRIEAGETNVLKKDGSACCTIESMAPPGYTVLARAPDGSITRRRRGAEERGEATRLEIQLSCPATSPTHPDTRWVWDDTTRWYPSLLEPAHPHRPLLRPPAQPHHPAQLRPDRQGRQLATAPDPAPGTNRSPVEQEPDGLFELD